MYAFVDFLCFAVGWGSFVWLVICNAQAYLLAISIAWIILSGLIVELVYDLIASFSDKIVYSGHYNSRIVYSDQYNLSLLGIEKLHPFDSCKYRRVYESLIQRRVITTSICPSRISRSLLLEKMTKWYLMKLTFSVMISKYIEMPLFFLPSFLLRWRVLNPMLAATQGSILAALIAIEKGWAINLSGGFHHATVEYGGGFCIYPDITLCVHYLRTRLGRKKIMIIDLDAHQGNGYERDHIADQDIFIIDFYNSRIYPGDDEAKTAIRVQVDVKSNFDDKMYLSKMQCIQQSIIDFRPEFIIYNAGTDILEGDPLGRLHITAEGIIERDSYIFNMGHTYKIPICMLLSGGYMKQNASIIADSIQNIYRLYA